MLTGILDHTNSDLTAIFFHFQGQSTPPPYTGPTTEPVCQDNHASCPNWASSGECGLNLEWMSVNCAKSCRTCGGKMIILLKQEALV